MRKKFRNYRTTLIVFSIYITTWVLFSLLLIGVNQLSVEPAFIFNDDVYAIEKAKELRKHLDKDLNLDYYVPLVENYRLDLTSIMVSGSEEYGNLEYTFADTLEDEWVDYYIGTYLLNDWDVYSVIEVEDKGNTSILEVTFYKYEGAVNILPLSDQVKEAIKESEVEKQYLEVSSEFFTEYKNSWLYTISEYHMTTTLKQILRNSMNHPYEASRDGEIIWMGIILSEVMESSDISSINFFYQSAVTITTVGFGDIVPTADLPRYIIMIESVLGPLLMGVMGASAFFDFQEQKKNNRIKL